MSTPFRQAQDEESAAAAERADKVGAWVVLLCSTLYSSLHIWLVVVNGFFWVWAVKNWVFGPLKGDAGIATFAVGLAAGVVELVRGHTSTTTTVVALVGCVLLIANFVLPTIVIGSRYEAAAARLRKPVPWVRVFVQYCWASVVFWGVGAGLLLSELF